MSKLILILASASIGREYLLKGLKIPYRIMPSKIDEDKIVAKNLSATIQLRAKLKGDYIAKQLINQLTNKHLIILSADTEVIIGKKLLGKPKDYKDAVKMMKMLSGKTHEVISAFYIIKLPLILTAGDASPSQKLRVNALAPSFRGGRTRKLQFWQGFDKSFVTFRKLTKEDIKLYLSITEYTRYTGSYALIASPQNFITKIEGSISNVIGLPLEKVIPIFRRLKILR